MGAVNDGPLLAGLVALAVLGGVLCALVGFLSALRRRLGAAWAEVDAARRRAAWVRAEAERAAARLVQETEERLTERRADAERERAAARSELADRRGEVERREARLAERERRLDGDLGRLAEERRRADERAALLDEREQGLALLDEERRRALEAAASLTAEEARAGLVAEVEAQAERESALLVRTIEKEAQREGEARAREIITTAVQRLATEQTAESVVSVFHLPEDEMKGRLIGREGRNIRAFETVTGVNVIIDDTPAAVLLSCFDPLRREVGRLTLEKLVHDGRIHPHRIEESYEASRVEVEGACVRAGEDALADTGITGLHPELTALLGRLRYRTSYGQNVLRHVVESAHAAGMMAAELGMDQVLMRRCALLHDVGKALTHESRGSHALAGAKAARRYGESEDVVHAIEAHHNEVEARTVEAVLTQAADAVSGGRPGARRASLESYTERMRRMEEIAHENAGVERVFAMQAGREVRVMVRPDAVDDIQAQVIARDVAKRVEEELTYPGRIRVTVIRESRATETAR
ncbi:ribonuclease Y [Nocardiopsis mwathae]|uniref:Ribonuclease Y n=1 Tax=Nocardiopsis mwathae TaxID=1472723 RepID=A0A7X0D476_9ACTN|nr:ribonuclease Y [Nocardiopsis mwathae]MBB6170795.1 ribonuclease Y [Nocardiopsis mwathae]